MHRSLLPNLPVFRAGIALMISCLGSLLPSALSGQTLTDEEADRIVAGEKAAIEESRAIKLDFTVVDTVSHVEGDEGVVFHKVLPPTLLDADAADSSSAVEVEPDFAAMRDTRERRSLSLGIQIYDGEISELIWRGDGRTIRAFSNIDFGYLTPVGELEGDGVVYSFFAIVTRTTREWELERRKAMEEAGLTAPDYEIPTLDEFSGDAPEYLVYPDSPKPLPKELFEALDVLHVYYMEHEVELKDAALRRESLAAARERYEQSHPDVPEPTVIHYWEVDPAETGVEK